jgi:ABC-type antimicrobial peptide transport system permease subunit
MNGILSPLRSLKINIRTSLLFLGLVFLLIVILSFSLQMMRRRKENAIREVLGSNRKTIMQELVIENVLVTLAGFLTADISYWLSAYKIINRVSLKSFRLQAEILRISSSDPNAFNTEMYRIDPSMAGVNPVFTLTAATCLTAGIALLTILSCKAFQSATICDLINGN